jgi:hypothetical protein
LETCNTARITAETGRQDAEMGLQNAETGRQDAETALLEAETGRQDAEMGLREAETGLREAETGRQNAETALLEAETVGNQMRLSNEETARMILDLEAKCKQNKIEREKHDIERAKNDIEREKLHAELDTLKNARKRGRIESSSSSNDAAASDGRSTSPFSNPPEDANYEPPRVADPDDDSVSSLEGDDEKADPDWEVKPSNGQAKPSKGQAKPSKGQAKSHPRR